MAHAIESELNMCVAELAVLQSVVTPYRPKDDYIHKLNALMIILEQIPDLVDNYTLKIMIGMLVDAFTDAHTVLLSLEISTREGWRRTFNVLNILHSRLAMLKRGARMVNEKLYTVCQALQNAIGQNETKFMAFQVDDSKNTKMHTILSKVGEALTNVTEGKEEFYDFLGSGAKKKVEAIIALLASTVPTPLRR